MFTPYKECSRDDPADCECGRPLAGDNGTGICYECQRNKPFIGRSWVSHLYLNIKGTTTQAAKVVQWYRSGKINDWQLWEILSGHGHPFAHAQDAAAVYKVLGFVPHAGYPLTKKEKASGI